MGALAQSARHLPHRQLQDMKGVKAQRGLGPNSRGFKSKKSDNSNR